MQMRWICNYTDQSDKSTGELSNNITACRICKRARIQATTEEYKTNNTHYGCKYSKSMSWLLGKQTDSMVDGPVGKMHAFESRGVVFYSNRGPVQILLLLHLYVNMMQ
jgi:hypothetical protein